ncbi:SRPBCC domain-containing protein [Myxococcota bacterium]|nr:SRPBCC domain-containing protein [Myxococcota bacterium]
MTLIESTAPAQTDTLSFDLDLRHPPKKVWRALTDPALLSEWLLPVIGLKLELGASFTLQSQPMPGWDGRVLCRILAIDEPNSLSYAWVVGDLDTIVTFSITPTDGGTRLSVVHAGFKPEQKQNLGGARYGWRMMSGKLIELLGRVD